jgi:threonine/homoserine/homoserine lactone efflux protein
MTWAEYVALLGIAFAMSFTPGPNTALSTTLAANHGIKNAMPFVFGVAIGWSLLLTVCAAGLGGLLVAQPHALWLVKCAGVGYLLFLAFKLWRTRQLAQAGPDRLHVTVVQGAALQFVNIKAWMASLAFCAGWLAGKSDAGLRFAVLLPTLVVFALASNLTYAAMGAALRGWLAQGQRLLHFNRAMAVVLAMTAAWVWTLS